MHVRKHDRNRIGRRQVFPAARLGQLRRRPRPISLVASRVALAVSFSGSFAAPIAASSTSAGVPGARLRAAAAVAVSPVRLRAVVLSGRARAADEARARDPEAVPERPRAEAGLRFAADEGFAEVAPRLPLRRCGLLLGRLPII
jgi:hypothetical protein